MKARIILGALILSLVMGAAYGQQPPDADSVARRAIDMLAGEAWAHARYFAFSFNVERDGKIAVSFPQRWDRFTGDYRVTGRNREGKEFLVIMNVNTKEGKAWLDGQEVADPKDLLTVGYRRFINDTYWLLMGFKSFDPGVAREYVADKGEGKHDVVRFSFSNVGLTPGDVYWMWVNKDTGLVDEWHMKLEGSKPEDEPGVVLFHDYRRIGGLLISTRREFKGRNQFIRLDDITVAAAPPPGAFTK